MSAVFLESAEDLGMAARPEKRNGGGFGTIRRATFRDEEELERPTVQPFRMPEILIDRDFRKIRDFMEPPRTLPVVELPRRIVQPFKTYIHRPVVPQKGKGVVPHQVKSMGDELPPNRWREESTELGEWDFGSILSSVGNFVATAAPSAMALYQKKMELDQARRMAEIQNAANVPTNPFAYASAGPNTNPGSLYAYTPSTAPAPQMVPGLSNTTLIVGLAAVVGLVIFMKMRSA